MATWVIICGSPYGEGTCSNAAREIAKRLQASGDHVESFSCADLNIHGCIGCDRCKETFTCIYEDDENLVVSALDQAEAVVVVTPLYFAGVPSQFKAVLDRFQPYYWKRQALLSREGTLPQKRSLYAAFVGGGGDPYGSQPARAQLASPFALADFRLREAEDFIGKEPEDIVAWMMQVIERERGDKR